MYKGKELIEFLMNIIPEVTYEEYLNFIDYKSEINDLINTNDNQLELY